MTQEELINTAIEALDRVNNTFDFIRSDFQKKTAQRRQHLINCLKDGVEVGDWHLVSDLANDLRVLEAKEGK